MADPRRRRPAPAGPPRRGHAAAPGAAAAGQGGHPGRLARRRADPCDHAGLLLLFPAMAKLGLHKLVTEAGYPSTSAITAWQSIGTLLLAKCARRHRAHHIDALTDDAGLFGLLADRAAQGHPRRHLLLPGAPRIQHQTAHRHGQGAAPTRNGQRHSRIQPRLPRHPPPRRAHRAGETLRAAPLPTHPRRAHLLRPGPRQHRDGLRQRRDHQGRAGPRDPRLRRLLAATPPAKTPGCSCSTPTDHLQGARRTHRARHRLAHPAPTRQNRTRPPGSATRGQVEDTIGRSGRYRRHNYTKT